MSLMKTINRGPEAWKYLKGIFCIYKPSGLSIFQVRKTLCFNLCRDLNELNPREPSGMVTLAGSVCTNKPFEVQVVPNLADHELVSGPRYQEQDIKMTWIHSLERNTSGVLLMTINDACWESRNQTYRNFIRKYEIKGQFGMATRTFMADGIVVERTTYHHIKQAALDNILGSIQACHQALAYKYSGIDIDSQAAYDLASKGLVKPSSKTDPLIYGIRCTEFNPPHFTLEVHCINETEGFLAELVHDIGIDLKSTAVCSQLRRTQFGPFLLQHALLRKHWTLENILNNLTLCQVILKEESKSFETRTIKALKQNRVIENMQKISREENLL